MYVLLFAMLFGAGLLLVRQGLRAGSRMRTTTGIGVLASTVALLVVMAVAAEYLWFDALGFRARFWTFFQIRLVLPLVGAAAAAGLALVLLRGAGRHLRVLLAAICAAAGALWGLGFWEQVLLFLHRVDSGMPDPLLGLDVGFYLFTLPLLDSLFWLALFVTVACLAAVLCLREADGVVRASAPFTVPSDRLLIPEASLALALVLAFGSGLYVCHLLYSQLGVVQGPGWTDVHVRLPALVLMIGVLVVAGVLPLLGRFRAFMTSTVGRWRIRLPTNLVATGGAWALVLTSWALLVQALPALVQWLVVRPNEITFEIPYIQHNIAFTRAAFKLDGIEERQFSAESALTRRSLDENRNLLSEVRLWDWRALDAVYKQFQEIRLYYEFVDVDIDRYQLGDRYRQVMVSARELAQRNLPQQSQTFVNQRFKYTHGFGYTLAPVSDFTPEGLPNLLVKDIPPKVAAPELAVERPEIYYGELTAEPVVVNTREPEFDYPSGEQNVYNRYAGRGGVQLSSFWRRFLYAWKFDGTVLLLSSYPTRESRILFHRRVEERVHRIAPFLVFDQDPYIAAVDGRLKWIVDAYTRSSYYPYSEPFDSREYLQYGADSVTGRSRTVHHLNGQNYVRNSVKAVVDAYDGSVDFYVFDEADPLIRAWQNVLPGMFRPQRSMPASLRAHVRYPQDFLLTQGLMFARYHMTDPAVFYNQEDVWVRATEKHYGSIEPVEPYYVMWELPGSGRAEFVLILPFTPKNRQVLIGWIAAFCDGDNYGRFIAYKFPKERRVLGPQQVETKIDQDSFLSGQLTLWDQQGSQVIRGNVLAIPIDKSLLYVEPIYLQAETAAYPELRLVAVMQGDKLSYAPRFADALMDLVGTEPSSEPSDLQPVSQLAEAAQKAFDEYLGALGAKRFDEAADALERLSEVLKALGNAQ